MSADRTTASSPVTQGDVQQVDYDVRAPKGGLRQLVEEFLSDPRRHHIDLTVSKGRGHRATVRVFPSRNTITRSSHAPDIVFFHGGTCFVVKDGKETGSALTCSGRVNLEVTIEKAEAGKLGVLHTKGESL